MSLRPWVAAMLLLWPAPGSAAEPSRSEGVIVTATRTDQPARRTLASTTVITREDIEREQAQTLGELFRALPGVAVANSGGAGKTTSVFLRGTEADHVLVLIDSVKVGSATLGTASFQHIPLEQVERIEIVRGPRSGLYGSEAIGGVIQIFTRRGGGPISPRFSLGTGSFGTAKGSAGVSGGSGPAWFNLGIEAQSTDGFNACNGRPSPGGAGCFTNEPDEDGYRSLSGSARLGYRFSDQVDAQLHFLRSASETEFDGSSVNEADGILQVLGGEVAIAPSAGWRTKLALSQSRDESDNLKDGFFVSRFDTVRHFASVQNDLSIGKDHLVTLGVDFLRDSIDSSVPYAVTSRDNIALFVQEQASIGNHDLQLALRGDDNEQFGRHATGSLAWGYRFSDAFRLVASYGTAFKAPTFNELYFPGFGNPKIQPETARSIEVGAAGSLALGRWSLTAFRTEIDDLIAFDPSSSRPENIDRAEIRGVEASLDFTVEEWDVVASLTVLDPENRSSGPQDGNDLPRRPRHAFRVNIDRAFGPVRLGGSLIAEGSRYDDLANRTELDPFVTLDLRGEWELARGWRVQGRLSNLFDEWYETAAFFNQPGRSVFVTLRYGL